ncbi:MAG: PDZ domain-containing protein [Candidatus Hydrogenedentes bacterium]|nr:PDZ domain-containing protein [Candidatus Hydrogenedentota bacterium]
MRSKLIGAVILAVAWSAGAQEFATAQLNTYFDKVSPAVTIVNYSSNVTNPNSGEITKRNTRALGLIVSPTGLVMVHGHMQLENSEPFNIKVSVGQADAERDYDAKLLTKPEDVNICFLQIVNDQNLAFPYVQFSAGSLDIGDPVALIGLMGETLDFSRSLVVRRIGAVLDKPRTTYCIDERLLFGFVGSPVMDLSGAMVGVVGFDLATEEGGDLYVRSGHPLVYQTELFARYIANPPDDEINSPKDDAFLGVFSQPLTDDLAEYWKLPADGGVVVGTVMPGSPADAAGIKTGDIITSFNSVPVTVKQDREVLGFTKLVRDAGIGAAVPVKMLRDGVPMDTAVTLTERPKSARDAGEFEDKVFGLTVREITTDLRVVLNLGADVEGVIVRRVKSGSWAQLAEVVPGVIIMNFGGQPVKTLDDFKAAVEKVQQEKPAEFTIFARVGSKTGFFRVQPRWATSTPVPIPTPATQ